MGARRKSGFTLVEILVAVALMGMLLLALNLFIFSMGEIWGSNSEQRLFDQHVRAVTRQVDRMLRAAAFSPVALGGARRLLSIQEIIGPAGARVGPLLAFELPAGDRTLPWTEMPLPDVVCALGAQPGQGLVLYWHSRLEKDFAEAPLRATVLSPFGSGLSYDYYEPDFKTWRQQPGLQKDQAGKWRLPDRITLRFAHGRMTGETAVVLPVANAGLPAF